jgi:hypothetical protein
VDDIQLAAPKRRFAGRRLALGARTDDMAAVADALLSPASAVTPARAPECSPPPESDPPRGLYLLVPAGIDGADRRHTALAIARQLAPRGGTAAILVFERGMADAHVLGELACGRLGPQNYLTAADADRAVSELMIQCDQTAIVLLDTQGGPLRKLGRLASRAVIAAAPDAESVVESYRELKAWRARGFEAQASLFVIGSDGAEEVGWVHERLQSAAHRFLGCDVTVQGYMRAADAAASAGHPEPLCIVAQAPAERIWPRLMMVERGESPAPEAHTPYVPRSSGGAPDVSTAEAPAAAVAASTPDSAGHVGRAGYLPPELRAPLPLRSPANTLPATCPVFSLWQPEERSVLVAAIEAQAPSLLAGDLRQIFRVDVREAGAPPLAGVRPDGGLVAILVEDGAAAVDTAAAARWLAVHRTLLARAYPCAGIREGAEPSVLVLAPMEPGPAAEGVRRFLPVRMGGHRGIVLVP